MGFKESMTHLEKCITRSALVCPIGFAAERNKLCVCVYLRRTSFWTQNSLSETLPKLVELIELRGYDF